MKLIVRKPGLFSTIQDLGRKSYQKYGISPAGALDEYAFILSNLLVGNNISDAAIELTLFGAEFEVLEGGIIAICGANMSAMINNKIIPMWESIEISKGDILSFGVSKEGCRTYLSIASGIDANLTLGSRSTYIRGKIGGINGNTIKEGDIIYSLKSVNTAKKRYLPKEFIPNYSKHNTVRVILGPQLNYFSAGGIRTFLSETFTFTNDMNRMACRLEGAKIEVKHSANIISDGTPNGAIQVPENGKPIILLNDRQTTGGYPKIACVISTDIQKIAQAKLNDTIEFKPISVLKAHSIYKNYINNINQVKKVLDIFIFGH